MLSEDGSFKYGYVEENNKIVGIVILLADSLNGFELLGLGVIEEAKKHGVGAFLLENSKKKAKILGYQAIEAAVFLDNKNMLRLLLKHDFMPYSVENGKRYDGMGIMKLKCSLKKTSPNPSTGLVSSGSIGSPTVLNYRPRPLSSTQWDTAQWFGCIYKL